MLYYKEDITEVIELLKKGQIVALPTDTVYGLAADAFDSKAVKRIFELKKRPADNPLIVHISDIEMLESCCKRFPDYLSILIKCFWPGPLTFILPKSDSLPSIVTSELPSVGLRMPNHSMMLECIKHVGPLAAPSANISGTPSSTHATHVIDDFGNDIPVLDDGRTDIGMESTVIHCLPHQIQIVRPGVISMAMIQQQIPHIEVCQVPKTTKPISPGQKHLHYAPKAHIQWFFSGKDIDMNKKSIIICHSSSPRILSRTNSMVKFYRGNFELFAHLLYDNFRLADRFGCKTIYIESFDLVKSEGIIVVLKDRIYRAMGEKQ